MAVGVVLALSGCGGGGKSAQSTTTVVSTAVVTTTPGSTTSSADIHVVTHGRFHYPQILVTNYMRSCIAGGGAKKRAYCACTLDKLSNRVSAADFARIGLAGGKIPPRISRLIRNAAIACADKL